MLRLFDAVLGSLGLGLGLGLALTRTRTRTLTLTLTNPNPSPSPNPNPNPNPKQVLGSFERLFFSIGSAELKGGAERLRAGATARS